MWQDDMRAVASFIKHCLDVYFDTGFNKVLAADQPQVAGNDVNISLSILSPEPLLPYN
jgi:hypothetical protein